MDLAGRTVLIAGGAGFIGSHLSKALLDAASDVVVADNLSKGNREWVPDGATLVETDWEPDYESDAAVKRAAEQLAREL